MTLIPEVRSTTPNVGLTAVSPTHDMKLTDEAGNSVGLIYCDRYGRRNPVGVNTGNMPRSPIRISTGSTGYSDQEPPFITEVQSTWVGGRAQADLSTDRTRFADSFRLDTTKQFPICAPAVIAQQGTGTADLLDCTGGTRLSLDIVDSSPVACMYPAVPTDRTVSGFTIFILSGTGASYVDLYYEAVVASSIGGYAKFDTPGEYTYSYRLSLPNTGGVYLPIEELTVPADSRVWLYIYADFPEGWAIGNYTPALPTVSDSALYRSAEGNWLEATVNRCIPGYVHYANEYDSMFFEYRKQMYVIMSTLDKNKSELYMNGYRGYCSFNVADLNNTIIDASGLVANELSGCIIYLLAGPGSQERRPWRKVVTNTVLGVCVMDKPWKIAHTFDTEYVVLGLNKWTHIPMLTSTGARVSNTSVKTVTVVGDYVVFGYGAANGLCYFKVTKTAVGSSYYYLKNNFATDAQYADVLQTITDKYGVTRVWRGLGAKVDCAIAVDWGSPYTTAPTLTFDLNYEEREHLYLQRDRLYVDLYKDIVSKNKDLADMDRQKNDLVREITQIIGAAGTINTPGTYTYHDGVGTVTVNSYLKDANTSYALSKDEITSLRNKFNDLTREHKRLIADHTRLTGTNAPLSDEAILIRKYNDLTLEHERILEDYDRLIGTNGSLTDVDTLIRTYDDLTTEHNRLVLDYARLIDADKTLPPATTLIREYDDLVIEQIRLLEDFDDSADAAVVELATEALFDNFVSRKRLAGSATTLEGWDVANRATITFGNAGSLSNVEYFGTHTAAAGSDIAISVAHNDARLKIERRDADIWMEKKRLAGSNRGAYVFYPTSGYYIFNPTSITYANGKGHDAFWNTDTFTAATGSDIAIAQAYNEATTKIAQRDKDIWVEKARLAGSYNNTPWDIVPANRTYKFGNGGSLEHDEYLVAQAVIAGSDIAIAQAYNADVEKIKQRDEDIYTEKTNLAGSTGAWSITSPTNYTFTANSIAHDADIGSSTGKVGSKLKELTDEYAIANVKSRELTDRAYAIIGTGTIVSPGNDSELKRIVDDIAYKAASLAYENAEHNSIYRQILDLTYQISDASNTDLENTATSAIDGALDLAAHVDRANWVNAKYLPTYIYAGDEHNPVTNIVGYGDTKIPYIIKTDRFGSISDGVYQELPIGEMKSISSILNGTAAMQFGVYLYFNLEGGMIERYYDQRLDDVGPNRDEGLPADRQGEITKLLPYPGRYYAAVDAGSDGYSSVLCNNMLGEYSWHEIWRSTTRGDQIYDVYVQTIPGFTEVDRLWIATTGSIIAVPIAITPVNQYKYEYFGYGASSPAYTYDFTTAGWVETSWIDFDVKSVDKYFHSVTIFSDYTGEVKTGDEYKISVYFKVDGDVDWWHAGDVKASEYINGKFEVGVKELPLQYLHSSVSGKKIKFRIKMMPCADEYESPRLKAIVINAILRLPSKRTWTVNFLVDPEVDLNDKPIHDATGVLLYWLNKWSNSKTYAVPLTMRTNDYSGDNLKVMIDPASLVTYDVITDQNASKNKTYRHIGSITLYEV